MTPTVISAAPIEPISVAEAKAHLRVTSTDEDPLLHTYIKAARDRIEWETGRTIITKTLEVVFDAFPSSSDTLLRLPRATPLTSVTSVKYTDDTGAETTWSASLYLVDTDSMPGGIKPIATETWPSFTAYPVNPIRIRYVAGASSATEEIKQAMFLMVERFFDHRSHFVDGRFVDLGYGLRSLLTQLKVEYVF